MSGAHHLRTRQARLLVALIVVGIAVATGWFAFGGDWSPLRAIGVPIEDRPFGDARTISGAGEALQRGLDPLVANPGDPWGRPMDYPRAWLVFAGMGLGPDRTWMLAAVFFAVAAAGAFALCRLVEDRLGAALLALGLLAPTTWLALERANNDLLMFGLCCLAAVFAARRLAAASALVAGAALLKLYPIAGAAALLRPGRAASCRWLVPLLLLFALYAGVTFDDIVLMQRGATRAEFLSYGADIVPRWLGKNTPLGPHIWLAVADGLLLAVLLIGLSWRTQTRLGAGDPTPALAGFRLGAAIYLGTFVFGSNFDYRLLFLLPALPQLARWSQTTRGAVRATAIAAIATILLLLWSQSWRALLQPSTGRTLMLAADELLAWSTWIALALLFALTLPEWLMPARRRGAGLADAAGTADERPALDRHAASGPRRRRSAG
ncbi:MAG: hypothetical protein U1E73_00180 [Planctomycetota bacterium]